MPTSIHQDETGIGAGTADGSAGEDKYVERDAARPVAPSSPAEFEEFTLYLLRTFGFELTRVGGSGDEGTDRTGSSLRLSCGPASGGYRDARLSASGWARR
jgi:hypothetical protein